MPDNIPHVFVSEAPDDSDRAFTVGFVRQIEDQLQALAAPFGLWSTEMSLAPGDVWFDAVSNAISSAVGMLFIVSPRLLVSEFVQNVEASAARAADPSFGVTWLTMSRTNRRAWPENMYWLDSRQAILPPGQPVDEMSGDEQLRAAQIVARSLVGMVRRSNPELWPDQSDSNGEPGLTSAALFNPQRVEHLSRQAAHLLWADIEPLIALATAISLDESTPAFEAERLTFEIESLSRQYIANPDEPLPIVVAAHQARLHSLVADHLPSTIDRSRQINAAAGDAANSLMGSLGAESPTADGETIAAVVDDVIAVIDQAREGNDRRSTAREVFACLGWTATGAGFGTGTLAPILSDLDPRWAAVIGAMLGLAGRLFKVKVVQDD